MAVVTLFGMSGFLAALKKANEQAADDVKSILVDLAQPASRHATTLAISEIRKVTLPWSENRVGVTQKLVYVVPRKRGTKDPRKKRPNFAVLLNERSYDPTAEAIAPLIQAGGERAVERIRRTVEFHDL